MKAVKKLLPCLLALALLIGLLPANAAGADYPDMPTGWSAEAVRTAVEAGLLRGDATHRLRPGDPITRAELATMLMRVFGGAEPGDVSGFPDLSPEQWYYEAVSRAFGAGLLVGYPNGTMGPDRTLTRAELFVVMARALKLPEGDRAALSAFADAAEVPDWAAGATAALLEADIIHGTGRGIAPGSPVTREQFCQILFNLFDTFVTAPGVYTGLTGTVLVCADGVELRDSQLDGLCVADAVTQNVTLVNCDCGSYLSESAAAAQPPEVGLEEAYAQFLRDVRTGVRYAEDARKAFATHGVYEISGDVAHAMIRRETEDTPKEYYAKLLEGGPIFVGLAHRKAGVWTVANSEEYMDSGFDIHPWPESLDETHFEFLGDGLYRAKEEYRNEEGSRFLQFSYAKVEIKDLRLQVRDGTIRNFWFSYAYFYGDDFSIERPEDYAIEFLDFGPMALTYPEETADTLDAEDIYYTYYFYTDGYYEAEEIVGQTGILEGTVCGTMDNCVILRDGSGYMVPVYFGEAVTRRPKLWDNICAVGVTEIDRFKTTMSVLIGDPEHLEISEGEPIPRVPFSNVKTMDAAYFDIVDFNRVQVPAIPEDSELEKSNYVLHAKDGYGNNVRLLLRDAGTAEEDAAGSAAQFRSALRAFVRARLDASGEETCSIDFRSVLMDTSIMIPIRETTFAEAAPQRMVFTPAERTVLAGTSLTAAITGVQLIAEDDIGAGGQLLADLDYQTGYNPLVAGDYEVTVDDAVFTIHAVQPDGAVFHDALDMNSLNDLPETFIGPSVPSEGDVNILVIPIRFTDSPNYGVDLEKAFNSTDGSTGWYSLREYYETVSYGKLRLNATILAPYESGYSIEGIPEDAGKKPVDLITGEALAYYDGAVDYSDYDSNGDGRIDCVFFVYDGPTLQENSIWWAYNDWYTPESADDGKFDGLLFHQYLWIGADWFTRDLHNKSEEKAEEDPILSCRTLIHETGHALGLNDYYGSLHNATGDSMMMTSDLGDHDPFSKLLLNWIDPAYDYFKPQTLKLRAFPDTGDTLIISGSGRESVFSQYYTVSLYTPDGVNEAFKDDGTGLFSVPGIVIYYVNAELRTDAPKPILYFTHLNVSGDYEHALIRLLQNNGRTTLRSTYSFDEDGNYQLSIAQDEDLFQAGDACLLEWPEDETLPCVSFRVDAIDRDEEGWYAIVTVG